MTASSPLPTQRTMQAGTRARKHTQTHTNTHTHTHARNAPFRHTHCCREMKEAIHGAHGGRQHRCCACCIEMLRLLENECLAPTSSRSSWSLSGSTGRIDLRKSLTVSTTAWSAAAARSNRERVSTPSPAAECESREAAIEAMASCEARRLGSWLACEGARRMQQAAYRWWGRHENRETDEWVRGD